MSDQIPPDQKAHDELILKLKEMGLRPEEIQSLSVLGAQSRRMAQVSTVLCTDEILKHSATLAWRQYQAFIEAGFTEDQAIRIVAANPIRVVPDTSQKGPRAL